MKIFVGNLNFSVDNEQLSEFFSQYGTVTDVRLIKDRETGRAKGFGFISFETEEMMEQALKADGQELLGRNLRVSKALEKQAR